MYDGGEARGKNRGKMDGSLEKVEGRKMTGADNRWVEGQFLACGRWHWAVYWAAGIGWGQWGGQ